MRIVCNACGAEVRHNHKRDPKLPRRVCACGAVGDWTPFPGLPTAAAKVPAPALDQVELDGSDLPEDLRAPFREAQAIFAAKLGVAAVAPGADMAAAQRQTDHYLLLVENLLRDALQGQARALARADHLHAQLVTAEAEARDVRKLRERLQAAEHDAARANADFVKLQDLHQEEKRLRDELDRAQFGRLAEAIGLHVHEGPTVIVDRALATIADLRDAPASQHRLRAARAAAAGSFVEGYSELRNRTLANVASYPEELAFRSWVTDLPGARRGQAVTLMFVTTPKGLLSLIYQGPLYPCGTGNGRDDYELLVEIGERNELLRFGTMKEAREAFASLLPAVLAESTGDAHGG